MVGVQAGHKGALPGRLSPCPADKAVAGPGRRVCHSWVSACPTLSMLSCSGLLSASDLPCPFHQLSALCRRRVQCRWWAVSCTGGHAGLWLCLWEAWVSVHLGAAYCSRSMRRALAPKAAGLGAGVDKPPDAAHWTAAVPWNLLAFHSARSVAVPLLMGWAPYWVRLLRLM